MIDINAALAYIKSHYKQLIGAAVVGYIASHYPMFSGPATAVGKCLGF